MSGEGLSDRLEVVSGGAKELMKREIVAFMKIREDLCGLYCFWCNHIGFSPMEGIDPNPKLRAFWALIQKLPAFDELYDERQADGKLVQYINKDYYENSEHAHHKNQCVHSLGDMLRELVSCVSW